MTTRKTQHQTAFEQAAVLADLLHGANLATSEVIQSESAHSAYVAVARAPRDLELVRGYAEYKHDAERAYVRVFGRDGRITIEGAKGKPSTRHWDYHSRLPAARRDAAFADEVRDIVAKAGLGKWLR